MALHRLTSITMGVPNVADTAAYYAEFGLSPDGDGWFTTRDAGRQLRIVHAPTRRLVELHVGVDDADDLARAAANLARLGIDVRREPARISAVEKATGTRAVLEIACRVEQTAVPATRYNGPGRYERSGQRAPGVLRTEPVMPRKLGHAVLGSTDYQITRAFFVDGLGFKVSDHIKGAGTFMRCSTDHHNVLVLTAPVSFLHHTSWQVDDIDEVGRGAQKMLQGNPGRHVWGLGGTTAARTSSGTSKTRRATSASTTATWTASSTTSCGHPKTSKARKACTPGARPHRRHSCTPTT